LRSRRQFFKTALLVLADVVRAVGGDPVDAAAHT